METPLKPRELPLPISQKRLARYPPKRCAGDFCQSQAGNNQEESLGREGRSSTTASSGGLGASVSDKALLPSTDDTANSGAERSSLRRKGDFKLEGQSQQGEHDSAGQESIRICKGKVVGSKKHASVVETPRTVPFRLMSFNVGYRMKCTSFARKARALEVTVLFFTCFTTKGEILVYQAAIPFCRKFTQLLLQNAGDSKTHAPASLFA